MSDEKKKRQKSGHRGATFGDALRTMFMGSRASKLSALEEEQMQSPVRTMLHNFADNKVAMAGVITFVAILLICFIFSAFYPIDKNFQDSSQQNLAPGQGMMAVPKKMQGEAKQADGGAYFGVGLDERNKLQIWGYVTPGLRALPKNMGEIQMVSAGLDHIIALAADGTLYSWGYAHLGVTDIPEAAQGKQIVQIEAGYQYSAAVDAQGNVYTWGNPGVMNLSTRAVQGNVAKVGLNRATGVALTLDGNLVCLSSGEDPLKKVPAELSDGNAIDFAMNDRSAAGLTKDGYVYTWGIAEHGNFDIPERVQGHVVSLEGGRSHYTVLLDDGSVASWGMDNYKQAAAPKLKNIVSISSDYYQNYAIDQDGKVHTWGLKGYLLGSDHYGRDIAVRMLSGGRITLTVGAISVIIAGVLGILIGGISGYYGGKIDMFLMRLTEVISAIPFLPLVLIFSALIGNNLTELGRMAFIMVVLGLLSWPGLARMVRAQILAEREKEFVTAAKALGVKEFKIIFRHILPNVITVALVNLTMAFATCMLQEATLSYLGFGIKEPSATWGNMLYGSNNSTVMSTYWWRWVFPAIALSITVLSINMAGDGMRDAIDPKSNDR